MRTFTSLGCATATCRQLVPAMQWALRALVVVALLLAGGCQDDFQSGNVRVLETDDLSSGCGGLPLGTLENPALIALGESVVLCAPIAYQPGYEAGREPSHNRLIVDVPGIYRLEGTCSHCNVSAHNSDPPSLGYIQQSGTILFGIEDPAGTVLVDSISSLFLSADIFTATLTRDSPLDLGAVSAITSMGNYVALGDTVSLEIQEKLDGPEFKVTGITGTAFSDPSSGALIVQNGEAHPIEGYDLQDAMQHDTYNAIYDGEYPVSPGKTRRGRIFMRARMGLDPALPYALVYDNSPSQPTIYFTDYSDLTIFPVLALNTPATFTDKYQLFAFPVTPGAKYTVSMTGNAGDASRKSGGAYYGPVLSYYSNQLSANAQVASLACDISDHTYYNTNSPEDCTFTAPSSGPALVYFNGWETGFGSTRYTLTVVSAPIVASPANEGSMGGPVALTLGVPRKGQVAVGGTSYYTISGLSGRKTVSLFGLASASDIDLYVLSNAGFSTPVTCDAGNFRLYNAGFPEDCTMSSTPGTLYIKVVHYSGTGTGFSLLVH